MMTLIYLPNGGLLVIFGSKYYGSALNKLRWHYAWRNSFGSDAPEDWGICWDAAMLIYED